MRRVNIEDYESLFYFQRKMRELGVDQKLKEKGVKDGDPVRVYNYELDWED